MSINDKLLEMIKNLTAGYFVNQVLTIVILYFLGALFLTVTEKKIRTEHKILLSFPLGLAVFSVSGALLLMVGIPFNTLTSTAAPLLILAVSTFFMRKDIADRLKPAKAEIFALPAVLIIALIATSGILPLSVANDSVYYYSSFPAMLVKSGVYSKSFDTYLTNVGQTSAVINCLPFLYGFDTSFGIQNFFNINFLFVFADIIYDELIKRSGRKMALLSAVAGTAFLASSTPYIVISTWVLSNVYFMGFAFILFYLLKAEKQREKDFDSKLFILFALLTMLRQEGSAIVLILILAASSFEYTNKKISLNFVLPVFMMEAVYYIMLFFRLGVDPLYSFLDWKKAAAILGAAVLIGVYTLVLRGRFLKFISDNVSFWLILAALLGNLAILVVSHSRYLTNLYAFYQNIRQGNGWGYFGIFFLLALMIMAAEIILSRFKNISYETGYIASMLMVTVAVAWARGGSLVVRTSDSGNRIMLQTVPFVVYILFIFAVRLIRKHK